MRFKSKEQGKLDSRRKLWSLFGWNWAYKRNDGGENKTAFTSDKHTSRGYGFFKHNHSLKDRCWACKAETAEKQHKKKIVRMKNKKEVTDLLKVLKNGSEEIDNVGIL